MKEEALRTNKKEANYNQDWKSNKVVECYITTLAQIQIENDVFFFLSSIFDRWINIYSRFDCYLSHVCKSNEQLNTAEIACGLFVCLPFEWFMGQRL